MTERFEDDSAVERRLRHALAVQAERAVDGRVPVPPLLRAEHDRPVRPLLAAVATVALIAGGTVYLGDHWGGRAAVPAQHSRAADPSVTPRPDFGTTGTATPSAPPATARRATHTPAPPARSPSTVVTPHGTGPTTSHPARHHAGGSPAPAHHVGSSSPAAGSAPTGACTPAAITVSVGGDRMVGTDGDYTFLEVVNGGHTCALTGYPTVAVLAPSGRRINGVVAQRATPAPSRLVLVRGARAEFEVYDRYGDAAGPGCDGDSSDSLQVTLPGQVGVLTVPGYGYSPCDLSVSAFHPPVVH